MTKLVFEIRRHGDEDQAHHYAFGTFPVTIGRGFDNDIILNDPYADARHLQIEISGADCIVSDAGSENGFTINGREPTGRRAFITPGDTLQVGHTEIRLYTPGHPVPPAIPLQKDHPILNWLSRPLNVWICFIVAMAITLGWGYLEVWSDEIGLTLAGVGSAAIGMLVAWATTWSLAGRLTRHRANFKGHVGLMCLYMIAGTACWYIEAYTDFLTNENWFSYIVTYGLNFTLLALLIYGSLTLATRMVQRRRRVAAAFCSFGVMAGICAFSMVSAKSFNQQPLYPTTLEPGFAWLAPAVPVDKFMAENKALFSSDTLSAAKKQKPSP